MTDKTDSKERDAFEAWVVTEFPSIDLTREGDGYYKSLANEWWTAFQAGRASLAANAGTKCERCSGSGEDPEGFYDQSRGDAGHTHEGPCRACDGSGVAANAGSEPVAPAGAAVLCWVNEDELPEGLTQEAYSALFPHSKVDVVRMFPVFGPTAQAAPAGAGMWANLKLMMEESAWDGTLQLSDALANIDDFAATHPSPPEGAGWRLCPVEPTDAMLDAVDEYVGGHCYSCSKSIASYDDCRRIWAAMIAAAPPASEAKGA